MSSKPAGLAHVREGFCFDKADDEAFALGWPHVRRLVDDEEVDVPLVATHHLSSADFDLSLTWPRRVAAALTHVWGTGALYDITPSERVFRKSALAAMDRTSTPTPDEVASYLRERLHRSPLWATERATRSFVLMLEALTDTDTVVYGILDELEAMDPDTLVSWATQPAWITFQLGYLLLRQTPEAATRSRERMAELVGRGRAWVEGTGAPEDVPCHLRSLRLVLEGAAAADKLTDRELHWYAHALDAPRTVEGLVKRHQGGALPDVRLLWLGGADLMAERTFRRWPRLSLRDRLWFQACIAPIQHPCTAIYMADMQGRPEVQDRARDWLRTHRDFALEVLKPMCGEHEKARRAVDLLR